MLKTTPDRMKLIVQIIEIAENVSKFLPIIAFSYAGLTLVFAAINFVEDNIVIGIVLCALAGFGVYLTIRICQTRRRWKRKYQRYRNTELK